MSTERITITMPTDVLNEVDRMTNNRSRFILDAVRHELLHRRREELRLSLSNPHTEASQVADLGLNEWCAGLPDDSNLVNPGAGRSVRWRAGEGWSSASDAVPHERGSKKTSKKG